MQIPADASNDKSENELSSGMGTQLVSSTSQEKASGEDLKYQERPTKGQIRRPTRPEHVLAFEFLKLNYEADSKAEIPIQKSECYEHYTTYCSENNYKPLVAADFGRILKSMFSTKDRRLGSRGMSKYCYVGVKRKLQSADQRPYTAEDLYNSYQTVICEWASTVLSRRMSTVEELAKYLLKNRFVPTRSCAALTITASMRDSNEDLSPDTTLGLNKHRETQLKLQEKLREKLKQASFQSHAQEELAYQESADNTNSGPSGDVYSNATPAGPPDIYSNPTSARTTPEFIHVEQGRRFNSNGSRPHSPSTVPSMDNSACTSPVYHEYYSYPPESTPLDYGPQGCATGDPPHQYPPIGGAPCYPDTRQQYYNAPSNASVSHPGSGRSTPAYYDPRSAPATPLSHTTSLSQCPPGINSAPATPLPHGIQSAPTTPLANWVPHRFDFSQAGRARVNQCVSLPGSARSTPVFKEQRDDNNYSGFINKDSFYRPTNQSNNSIFNPAQRLAMGQSNSAFMPIREAEHSGFSLYDPNEDQSALNELLSIIDKEPESQQESQYIVNTGSRTIDSKNMNVALNMSVNHTAVPAQSTSNGTVRNQSANHGEGSKVLINLLTKQRKLESVDASTRYRHHSGPPLGRSAPPLVANGANQKTAFTFSPLSRNTAVTVQNSIEGTMSPPAQPLNVRKRQHSGEAGQSCPTSLVIQHPGQTQTGKLKAMLSSKPHTQTKLAQHLLQPKHQTNHAESWTEFTAKRNLSNLVSPLHLDQAVTDPRGDIKPCRDVQSAVMDSMLTPPASARVTPENGQQNTQSNV